MLHPINLVYQAADEGEYKIEAIQAIREGAYYRLVSIPFFAKHLAMNDVVSVEDDEGAHFFEDIILRSGHSALRIIFFDSSAIKTVVDKIKLLRAEVFQYEESVLFAVDIPPSIDYALIEALLVEQMAQGILDYEEACLGWK